MIFDSGRGTAPNESEIRTYDIVNSNGNPVQFRSCPRSCKVITVNDRSFHTYPLKRQVLGRGKDDKPENLPGISVYKEYEPCLQADIYHPPISDTLRTQLILLINYFFRRKRA